MSDDNYETDERAAIRAIDGELSEDIADAQAQTDESIKKAIVEIVGDRNYKIWFKNTTRFMICDADLRVIVPSAFVENWLRRKYDQAIKQAAKKTTGRDLRIEFIINGKGFHYGF